VGATLLRASSIRDMTAESEVDVASPEVTLERLKTPPRSTAALEPFISEEKLTEIIQVGLTERFELSAVMRSPLIP
jgi:hypothetical protein